MALTSNNSLEWELQGAEFQLREISASTIIGKVCGSIVTRPQYTRLLDAVQARLGLTIRKLPAWLQDIELTRSASILGDGMRRIKVARIMTDTDVSRLSGLATFVVLCSQYGDNVSNVTGMLNQLLVGALGTVVHVKDYSTQTGLPYSFKPHVTAFIASCLDANRDSDIYKNTISLMAQLHVFGEVSWRDNDDTFARQRQASFDLMGELLGNPAPEEAMSKNMKELFHIPDRKEDWARVHHTLHLSSAYMALAAAAHGANVVVECISRSGSKFIPAMPNTEKRKTAFLVRFWLIQPPEDVYGILRYSSTGESSTFQDREQDRFGTDPDYMAPTIFGGTLEIATCIARNLGFHGQIAEAGEHEELMALWYKATDYAKRYRWAVLRQSSKDYLLRFTLHRPEDIEFPPAAISLSKCLQTDRRLRPIARTVAALVHDYYKFTDYVPLLQQDGDSQITKAMDFVLLAMAVQVLRSTISPASDSPDTYALNVGTLETGKRGLRDLMALAVSDEGVTPSMMVCTAATVWGGLSPASYRTPRPGDTTFGVVAPHCCVLLDLIRDPLEFARESMAGYIISIWRGALPMLPRDPHTNFLCGYADADPLTSNLTSSYDPSEVPRTGKYLGVMLVTFEPHVNDPTRGVFCTWWNGFLASEIHPEHLLSGLLKRSATSLSLQDRSSGESGITREIITLSKIDILHLKSFKVEGEFAVVIGGIDDPAWLVFAVGCCALVSNIIVHEVNNPCGSEGDFKDKLKGGEVVICKNLKGRA
ncbi:hypothetical protein F4803DRAFT_528003 [Xylaria telfairii]|nr:hypothetical protein F4803DRAFT_528003 [Xylaria telfairii]